MKKFLAIPLLLALVATVGIVVGCKQGEGDRCQVKEDCDEGLVCNQARNPPVCQSENEGGGIDATPPIDAPDAAVD
ncbi:MAG: hypothetical protein ABI867_28695 [Kofleriaceae bacterium]